ncbi:MAG TPA: nitroreductase/quinone reductase family protein [Acidimicrobiales bacterium]|nr:nitroreductase/quinone reductase family protein [Acidimicrobiales bacterium]
MTEDTIAERLRRISAYEAGVRKTPVTRLLLNIGGSAWFARVYRRLGPAVDPWMMRRSHGRIISRVYGLPALLLATRGRRSGERRVSPLLYIRDGDDFVVVGTNFGQHQHPGWTANLLADPEAEVTVGPETLRVRAEMFDEENWQRMWPRFVAVYPGYQSYLTRTGGRHPRMFVLRPTG